MSPPLIPQRLPSNGRSEFRLEGYRQVGKDLAEPFLLQLAEPAARFFLGDEVVHEGQYRRVALCHGPGRIRLARNRLADLEHGGLLGDERLDVDDGVDDVIDALE